MPGEARKSASKAFKRDLRRALAHLYDPTVLRASPLIKLLGVEGSDDPVGGLRRILIEAIAALKPSRRVPPQAGAWRVYHILSQRYIEQFTQGEVATDMALSIRQLRRQEDGALEVLADCLWSRYRVEERAAAAVGSQEAGSVAPAEATDGEVPSPEQELQWLQSSLSSEPAAPNEVIAAALKIAAPLAAALHVSLEAATPDPLPRLAVQATVLRQALLNLVTAAIRLVPGGVVAIEASSQEGAVSLQVRPIGSRDELASPQESLVMARTLAEHCGGQLEVVPDVHGHPFSVAILRLPIAQRVTVLVIDDNPDILHLFQRYASGTSYQVVGERDARQAVARLEEIAPQIIILDVMLPGLDGWELLGRLREHPQNQGVPIIVCTILPQEQLALALGATGFLRKPVSRTAFLAALSTLGAPLPERSR